MNTYINFSWEKYNLGLVVLYNQICSHLLHVRKHIGQKYPAISMTVSQLCFIICPWFLLFLFKPVVLFTNFRIFYELPHFSRKSAQRWLWGRQPYALGRPLPPDIPDTKLCLRLRRPQGHSAAEMITWVKESNNLIGNRTGHLQACSIVPQSTSLPRASLVLARSE
jgi:hypothetical protein